MKDSLKTLANDALRSARDLSPIILVISVFQVLVFREPVAHLFSMLFGILLVIAGLSFFLFGLRLALFPVGEGLALVGIDAATVRDVIISHMHYDHCGNAGLFPLDGASLEAAAGVTAAAGIAGDRLAAGIGADPAF